MTLEEITALEYEWMSKHPYGASEYFEVLDDACERMGIYDAWRMIFREYVSLAMQGNLEALKRALFILWYECSEPNELTGIKALDRELIKNVFGIVNDLVMKGQLDDELRYMLPYYYSIADFYIDRFDGFSELKKFSKEDSLLYWELCPKSSFDNRGQLGRYWGSCKEGMTRDWGDMGAYL